MRLAFCHNTFDRPNTLIQTIKVEKELFQDSIISVAYNNKRLIDFFRNNNYPSVINKYIYFDFSYFMLFYEMQGRYDSQYYYKNFYELEAEYFATDQYIPEKRW